LVLAQLLETKGMLQNAQAMREKAETVVVQHYAKFPKANRHPPWTPWDFDVPDDDPKEKVRILESAKDNNLTPVYRLELALAYFESGRADEGLAQVERLPDDPKVIDAYRRFFLGEALKKAGLNTTASEQYRKAYEMDPENVTYRYEYEATKERKSSANSKSGLGVHGTLTCPCG
jgi:tetratricopeptide (TPR) repeat protein